MRRRVFTLASAISLVIYAALVALWLFLPQGKIFKFDSAHHRYEFWSRSKYSGMRIWGGARTAGGDLWAGPGKHWDTMWASPTHQLPIGFAYGKAPSDDPTAAGLFCLLIPSWTLIVLFSLLPTFWLYRWRFHPVRLPGECRRCGYDLTGNASGVCPECGAPITVKQESAQISD